jgi:hypothetical protein
LIVSNLVAPLQPGSISSFFWFLIFVRKNKKGEELVASGFPLNVDYLHNGRGSAVAGRKAPKVLGALASCIAGSASGAKSLTLIFNRGLALKAIRSNRSRRCFRVIFLRLLGATPLFFWGKETP